jgi:hypothetical protein
MSLFVLGCSSAGEGEVRQPGLSSLEIQSETDAPLELTRIERELSLGASGADVRQASRFFLRYGYFENETLHERFPAWSPLVDVTPADLEVFGPELESAVRAYQGRTGLPETGVIDAPTLTAMRGRTCEHPDTFEDTYSEKWAHWAAQGFQSNNTFTYRVTSLPGTPSAAAIGTAVANAIAAWTGPTVLTSSAPATGPVDVEIRWENFDNSDAALARGGGTLVRFNTDHAWSIGAVSGAYDVQSVLTHELGHILGLDHSNVAGGGTPVMWPNISSNSTRRNLRPDDTNALMASPYTRWLDRGGLATHIAAGANGAVWITGTGATNGGFQIWRRSGSSWVLVDGGAVKVAVEPNGTPWVVNSSGSIFRRAGVTAGNPSGTSWTTMPGGATDIAIGTEGTVYVLGTDNVAGNHSIFRWSSSSQVWTQVSGAAAHIAVDSTGRPWVVNASNNILRLNGSTWGAIGGLARDIGAGSNGSVWIIGTGLVGTADYEIWSWNDQPGGASGLPPAPARASWVKTSGGARAVTVDGNGKPWVVNSDGRIYQRDDD